MIVHNCSIKEIFEAKTGARFDEGVNSCGLYVVTACIIKQSEGIVFEYKIDYESANIDDTYFYVNHIFICQMKSPDNTKISYLELGQVNTQNGVEWRKLKVPFSVLRDLRDNYFMNEISFSLMFGINYFFEKDLLIVS